MPGATPTRYGLLGLVLLCYFSPLCGFSLYLIAYLPASHSLSLLSCGLLAAFLGSLLLFIFLQQWETANEFIEEESEEKIDNPFSNNAHDLLEIKQNNVEWQQKLLDQESLLNKREQELYLLSREKERFQRQAENLLQEFAEYRGSNEEQLHQKEIFISELQQTLAEQRASVEKKQQQVTLLENKVGELRYEIRTLLQLAEVHTTSSHGSYEKSLAPEQLVTEHGNHERYSHSKNFHSKNSENSHDHNSSHESEEANHLLRRCIEIAEKMTGVPQFSQGHKRLSDLPINPFSLDLRRLCDALSNVNASSLPVLLYSPREKQLLFAHPAVKQLVGWTPEKFSQHFDEIIAPSLDEWQKALSHLSYRLDTPACLRLQNKNNEIIECDCLLGLIPSGVFRNYAIAVLQPIEELLSSQTSA